MAGGMGQYYEAYFWPFLLVHDFKFQKSHAMQTILIVPISHLLTMFKRWCSSVPIV